MRKSARMSSVLREIPWKANQYRRMVWNLIPRKHFHSKWFVCEWWKKERINWTCGVQSYWFRRRNIHFRSERHFFFKWKCPLKCFSSSLCRAPARVPYICLNLFWFIHIFVVKSRINVQTKNRIFGRNVDAKATDSGHELFGGFLCVWEIYSVVWLDTELLAHIHRQMVFIGIV